ncbi:MAG: 6-phosphofructokinase [Planctomycetes bacterium]|nr:6-phosphofructokinase [Planctomycetota bacterium]
MAVRKLGILVGGGPAPGINGVINAATIEAINRGIEVIGFYEGFRWLASEKFDAARHALRLDIGTVARIHFDGGSILRTSRTSLLDDTRLKSHKLVAPDAEKLGRVIANFRKLGIDSLLTIGGDDTALSARFVCDSAENGIRVVNVPKTIDNDLPLPADVPTFGFSTARLVGTNLLMNLMRDSQTTGRWYICEAMGRTAGWLALSIGMAAGATVTLIPEEFPGKIKVSDVLDVLEGAIIKRRAMGRPDGVAIVAEGLAYRLGDKEELEIMLGHEIPLDAAGHMRLSEVNLAQLLKNQLQARFRKRGQSIEMVDHELGYELRSADPTPFDMAYCRMLGYFAIQLLLNGNRSSVMVSIKDGNLHPIEFHDMIDPNTNRTRTRVVNLDSDVYRVARAYMIRLERADFENPEQLARLAAEAKMTPEEFRAQYEAAAARK